VTDETAFLYQTETWGAPAEMKLVEKSRGTIRDKETVTVEAKLYDAKGVLCLDARNRVRFSIAGVGTLIDNHGTTKASRVVELCNGRGEITLLRNNGGSVVSADTHGIKTVFCTIT
jgi:beta-galactosidase